jgi:hypothetical protein
MQAWLRKSVLIALLLVLPLQGVAATLSPLTCVSSTQDEAASIHVQDHSGGTVHEHDGDSGKDFPGHPCGHNFFSGIPAIAVTIAPTDLPEFSSSVSLLATLFIPEQPQRPPRV